ncbi:hypothetical protein XENTR_v10014898 [Xenopus tropicalis]|uniref:Lymphotactin n=1 Tax=Xenopus tropicalis TaxID=8364 RepID=A0A8J0QRI6_XENTR|nr:lymphotactin [Xenopus tropicalis]KAE8604932.1 hypothetical protein XENTR_v10014898 [Xenopus tropicalis]|eukprot:XP_002939964.1 PREDICTED: lymphotactin-like [Xenopus tropicalis]
MKLLFMALLIGLGMVLLTAETQGQGGELIFGKICLETKLMNKIKCKMLKSYVQQTSPVAAIMFTTQKNITICANPEQPWVKQAVQCLKTKKPRGSNPKKRTKKKKNGKAKSKSTP